MRTTLLSIVLLSIGAFTFLAQAPSSTTDESIQIEEGFQIQMIASEPLISDPVAMEVDEYGNVYVVEMPGYPLDVSGNGRVRLLKDTDADGVLDESTLFAEGLVLPTGIMRWKDGIIITAPPDIIYLKDTDGDHVADHQEVLVTGFARSNPQHNFNAPKYGLDNWIYVANNGIIWTSAYKDQFGDIGSNVHFPSNPEAAQLGRNGNNRNVRFKPDSHEIESLSGRSQFGHTFDPWGHHFSVSNAHPQFHEVIAARYIDRSPILTAGMAMHYTPEYGRNTSIYPITESPEHMLLTDRGMITSAAGITYYKGGLFPEPYTNVTFVGEPVHNLVHVLSVEENGPTFTGKRVRERKEFLASKDGWFRPVNFYTGPDGALYMIDYHRAIVEHPEWMDDATAASGRLQEGTQQGRIYRITPEGTPDADWMNALSLGAASNETLASYLEKENIWWRRTAQRLLVDRKATDAAPGLVNMVTASSSPEGRLHALWTLEGIGMLKAEHVIAALKDDHPGVRENALILAEGLLGTDQELETAIYAMHAEQHSRVRFQLLCTLGYLDTQKSKAIRQKLIAADLDNEWMQLASLSTMQDIDLNYFRTMAPLLIHKETEGRALFLERLSNFITSEGANEDLSYIYDHHLSGESESPEWAQVALLKGISAGVAKNQDRSPEMMKFRDDILSDFSSSTSTSLRAEYLGLLAALPKTSSKSLKKAIKTANTQTNQHDEPASLRAQSITLLSLFDAGPNKPLFESLIQSANPVEVQLASVQALGRIDDQMVGARLLEKWASMTPPVRNAVLDVLMKDEARMEMLLNGIEEGTIQTSAIGWDRTVRLMRDTKGALKTKARDLLSEPPGVREQVVEDYMASMDLEGSIDAGKEVFTAVCSTCHQMAGAGGVAFGPDLGTVRHWSPAALVASILIPQKTITDGYGLWSVELTDGMAYTGLIASESPSEIELRQLGLPDKSISRNSIETLTSMGVSAMPNGLEAQLSKQQMADLIAYLRFN